MPSNTRVATDVDAVSPPEWLLESVDVPAVLICGPPMQEKFGLLLTLLSARADHAIVITTKHPATAVIDAYAAATGGDGEASLGVVDALDNSNDSGPRLDRESVRVVGSPGNLTRIGIEFSDLLEAADPSGPVAVGLHTLSPLVMAADLQPVYRFLGAMMARLRRDGHHGVVVLDTPVGDHDATSLRHHFDAVIETRTGPEGRRQLRLLGTGDGPTEWAPY